MKLTGPQRRVLEWIRLQSKQRRMATVKGRADLAVARALERRGLVKSVTNKHGAVLWALACKAALAALEEA